ncbi:multiubiquitin domain-containing protein [Sphingobium sp. JS3065]|uniref:multiubiquitin domain-containing protein n=1 Tax=Sphingobium sp. JS3065 TaxID=2970925 RepID=UPI002264DB73|nr:multiubiquitin domain-containing protein [Sphingobium sp. JS3065]UZW57650.1 multiubiquitin domain-containing protein [Sphingobium sp. JS3065]
MSILENHDIDDVELAVQQDRPLRPGRYRVHLAVDSIGFTPLVLDDPVPLGRQILKKAGIIDLDGHSLFLIRPEGDFEDVRADEEVDLRDRGAYRFIAFSTDPLYRVKLNEARIVWGRSSIPEAVLRALAGIGDDEAVFLEVRGGKDKLIKPGTEADLSAGGVEKFITAPNKVTYTFFVNGKPYETEKKKLTGAQIKEMVPDWDPQHDLSLEGEGDEPDRTIADDEAVSLDPKHGVRRFSSVPKANFG